jgi:hypothetical protein
MSTAVPGPLPPLPSVCATPRAAAPGQHSPSVTTHGPDFTARGPVVISNVVSSACVRRRARCARPRPRASRVAWARWPTSECLLASEH